MEMKFHHIGVFVKDLAIGREHLRSLFPIIRVGPVINDELLKVFVQFLTDENEICYEIITPNGTDNPVQRSLIEGKNLLNHIAYKVEDFDLKILEYRRKGCIPLGKAQPAVAFEGARVVFFLTPLEIIVELIETKT